MKLNVTVHGRLHAGTPLARPCFPRGGNVLGAFNAAQCSVVEDGYVDHCTLDLHVSMGRTAHKLPSFSQRSVRRLHECEWVVRLDIGSYF